MRRLDGLDGLRGIAALWVVIFHVIGGVRTNAYLSVDFFFVLSGYVMARRYEPGLTGDAGPAAGFAFLKDRVVRLYPTVFLASLAGLPWLYHVAGQASWPLALAGASLLPIPSRKPYALNPPIWSVAYELFVNALHAAFLARLGPRSLIGLCVACLALVAHSNRGHGLNVTPGGLATLYTALRALGPYFLGIALHRLWRDEPPLRISAPATWLLMPVFFVCGTLFAWENSVVDYLFVLFLCPILIAGGVRNGRGSRIAKASGALSFPLYAIHGPVLVLLKGLGFGIGLQLLIALLSGVAMLGVLTCLPWARGGIRRLWSRGRRLSPLAGGRPSDSPMPPPPAPSHRPAFRA